MLGKVATEMIICHFLHPADVEGHPEHQSVVGIIPIKRLGHIEGQSFPAMQYQNRKLKCSKIKTPNIRTEDRVSDKNWPG